MCEPQVQNCYELKKNYCDIIINKIAHSHYIILLKYKNCPKSDNVFEGPCSKLEPFASNHTNIIIKIIVYHPLHIM